MRSGMNSTEEPHGYVVSSMCSSPAAHKLSAVLQGVDGSSRLARVESVAVPVASMLQGGQRCPRSSENREVVAIPVTVVLHGSYRND